MISANEFYYFNKMLDGKEIYGIVDNEDMKGGIGPKASLIKKRILEPDGKMNRLSTDIFRNLDKYKKAKDYIWINESIASLDKSDDVVYLRKNKGDDYTFRLMSKTYMLNSILENYSFLSKETSYEDVVLEDDIQEKMTIKVFLSTILNKKDMSEVLYIKKEYQKIQCIYNIYYEDNNSVYKYDVLEKIVVKMNADKVRRDLIEIFNISMQLN